MRYPWGATDSMLYFINNPPNAIVLSRIEEIWCEKMALRYDFVIHNYKGVVWETDIGWV